MPKMNLEPKIIAFVTDLFFVSRIGSTAEGLGFDVLWVENAAQIAPMMQMPPAQQPGEHLVGPGAALIDQLTKWHPSLVIMDLGNAAIPWREWLPLIKSAPATRRIPVICFGSHVHVDDFKAARSSGAEEVVARSRFVQSLPELIRKHARTLDSAALQSTCQEQLSDLAIRGFEEFNRREYFESHESLEAAWNQDTTLGRELYRAVLQVAVAYLQIERRNYRGAIKMFLRMRQWIDPLPEECRGVDIASLRRAAYQVEDAIRNLGPEGIQFFDMNLLEPLRYRV